jgi:GGDEF domain-containing protein
VRYTRFEILAVAVVICAVAGTIFATASSDHLVADIAGQVLIVVALLGGLHYGRKGAVISFLVATGLYAIFLFGFKGDMDMATAWELFALRTLVFAVVAFVGGELNVRLKYIFMKLEHQDYVDNLTSLYNAQYLSKLIDKHISEFDRYGSRFSLSSFTVSDTLVVPMRKKARQKMVKELGNSVIRGNIRGADEAARLEGMTFTVLFPNTSHDGATCASIRIKGKIVGYLEKRGLETEDEQTILNEILEYPRDKDNVEAMATSLLSSRPKNGSKAVV